MYLRIDGMGEPLAPNCILAEADINLRPIVKVCEFLTVEKQGREPIVTPRPSALINREFTESLTQAISEGVHAYRPRPPNG